MHPDLKNVVFIDLETATLVEHYRNLDSRMAILWDRKVRHLLQSGTDSLEELYLKRAGIYAEFARIITIGIGRFVEGESEQLILELEAISCESEVLLLEQFIAKFNQPEHAGIRLCAHNGKEFDFPFLCRRMICNNLPLPSFLDLAGKKPWEIKHLDTMDLWKFGDYKQYTSLELLAALFGIPSSKTDLSGDQVSHVYHGGGLGRIIIYCLADVSVLARVYLRIKGIYPKNEPLDRCSYP